MDLDDKQREALAEHAQKQRDWIKDFAGEEHAEKIIKLMEVLEYKSTPLVDFIIDIKKVDKTVAEELMVTSFSAMLMIWNETDDSLRLLKEVRERVADQERRLNKI